MRHLLICGLIAMACAGCRSSAPSAHEAVVSAIRSTPAPDRMHGINEAAHQQRGQSASLSQLLDERDPQVRWAAAYVAALWADDQDDVEALTPYLSDRDEAIRAVIAGSLAGLGHHGARESLAGLAASGTGMPFSDPPITVGRFATDALAAIDRVGQTR